MRCNCCDRELDEKEIIWNTELQAWEMCNTCLDIAMDAAYSQGFSYDDEDSLYIIDEEYDDDIAYAPVSDWYGGFTVKEDSV